MDLRGFKFIDATDSDRSPRTPKTPPSSPSLYSVHPSLENSISLCSGLFINSESTSPWPDSPGSGSPTPRPDSPDPRLPPSLRRSFAHLHLDMLDRDRTPKGGAGTSTYSIASLGTESPRSRPATTRRRCRTPFPRKMPSELSSGESSQKESDWEDRKPTESPRKQKTNSPAVSKRRARREEELAKVREDDDGPIVPITQREWVIPALPTDEHL